MNFNKIFSDSIVSTARTILFASRRLLIIPVVAKFIGEGEYGIWATAISLVALFAAAGRLHMHGALIRYSSQQSIESEVFSGTLLLTTTGLIFSGAIFSISALSIGIFDTAEPSSGRSLVLIALIAALVVTSGLFSFLSTVPRAMDQVKKTEAIVMVELLVEIIVVIGVLYITTDIIMGLTSVLVVTLLFDGMLGIAFIPGRLTAPSRAQFSQFLRYAVPLMPKELSDSILSSVDKVLILFFISPTAAGVYSIVYSLCSIFRTAAGVLNSTLYPAVTTAWDNGEQAELRRLYKRIFEGYAGLAIPGYVGLLLIAPSILALLATPQVARQGVILVPIIAAGFLLRSVESPISYVLNATEETHIVGYISILAAAINGLLNLTLIPILGLLGAAGATLVSNLLITAVVVYFASQSIKFTFPLLFAAKSVLSTIVMAAVLWLAPEIGGVVGVILFVVLGVCSFGVSLVLFRGVTVEEATQAVRLVKQLR